MDSIKLTNNSTPGVFLENTYEIDKNLAILIFNN